MRSDGHWHERCQCCRLPHPLQAAGACALAVERADASGARADGWPSTGPGAACVCAFKGTRSAGPAATPRRRGATSAAAPLLPRLELPSRAAASIRGRSNGSTADTAPSVRALPVLELVLAKRRAGGGKAAAAPLLPLLLLEMPGRSNRLASREAVGTISPAGCRGDSADFRGGIGAGVRLPSPRGDAGEAARGGECVCGRGECTNVAMGARASSTAVAAGGAGGGAGVGAGAAAARVAS